MNLADFIDKYLVRYLMSPAKGPPSASTCDPDKLASALKAGDVLLVDNHSRVASAIKFLTNSTWSHAALYVGPIEGRAEPDGEPHVMVEAELGLGIISSPLSRFFNAHTRICRPVGLGSDAILQLTSYAIGRIGEQYDTRNVIDLARYLLPYPPVPKRYRRKMIALGSGSPTRAICSTLIAQAFESVHYPVLPVIECLHEIPGGKVTGEALKANQALQREILHIRHYSLYTPADFDLSPYFDIVKPTIERGFDYRALTWS